MKHLRTTADVGTKDIVDALFLRAEHLKRARRDRRLAPTLAGRVVGLVFERESTRTRMSFESGVKLLGGNTISLHARDTQLVHGEPIRDVARVLGGYVDLFVTRTREQSTVDEYARFSGIPVVNGLSNLDHPCQVLTDFFTVYERRENPTDVAWAFVGDATPHLFGLMTLANLLGFPLRVAVPDDAVFPSATAALFSDVDKNSTVTRAASPHDAVRGAGVILTGPSSTTTEYDARFRIDGTLLSLADDRCFVLHALPAKRGREISDDVLEGPHSLAFEQAKNRLVVQQAIVERLLGILPEAM